MPFEELREEKFIDFQGAVAKYPRRRCRKFNAESLSRLSFSSSYSARKIEKYLHESSVYSVSRRFSIIEAAYLDNEKNTKRFVQVSVVDGERDSSMDDKTTREAQGRTRGRDSGRMILTPQLSADKRWSPGLVYFVTALAYLFCPAPPRSC